MTATQFTRNHRTNAIHVVGCPRAPQTDSGNPILVDILNTPDLETYPFCKVCDARTAAYAAITAHLDSQKPQPVDLDQLVITYAAVRDSAPGIADTDFIEGSLDDIADSGIRLTLKQAKAFRRGLAAALEEAALAAAPAVEKPKRQRRQRQPKGTVPSRRARRVTSNPVPGTSPADRIVAFLKQPQPQLTPDIALATGLSAKQCRAHLRRLVKAGLVKATEVETEPGTRRNQYTLTAKGRKS